jgi:hypothetical protein
MTEEVKPNESTSKPNEEVASINSVPMTPEEVAEKLKELKAQVFDIMGKQSGYSSLWTNLENEKSKILKEIGELEKTNKPV